ncbi:uncharacterized protein EI90DRAFT_1022373 [Cantharellus anzutake]|uniref:uncharacterized protein n=1 Tax=Cantharellus anzutake TaxID=1750568 RepID=UPI0019049791|nr:uncharacterized protein EI90DRAFT_1022373 [Cantharellus anzutake]KAF8331438.1 hypothetical protein EI90DRAFT_1022373 [Cantharellus anzutake]
MPRNKKVLDPSQHPETKRPAPENNLQAPSQASTSSEVPLVLVDSAPIEDHNKSHHNSPDNSIRSRLRPPNTTRTSQSGSRSRREPKRQVRSGSVTAPPSSSESSDPNHIYRSNVSPSWASGSTTSVHPSLADPESSLSLPSSPGSTDNPRPTPRTDSAHSSFTSFPARLQDASIGIDVPSLSKPVSSSASAGGDIKKSFISDP